METSQQRLLSLSITEQPSETHRFRYGKEVNDGRMGSVLRGRSGPKSFVRVTVTRQSEIPEGMKLKLIGCTVFEDLAPHPFYLCGDGCTGDGLLEKEISFTGTDPTVTISLDRLGIVCTAKRPRGKEKVKKENQTDSQEASDAGFEYRKAHFNLFNKIHSKMVIDYLIPKSVNRKDQDVWLYMKDPLPGESVQRFEVVLAAENSEVETKLRPKAVKKHLVVFNFSNLGVDSRIDGPVSASVLDLESRHSSTPVTLQVSLPAQNNAEPPHSKKARLEKHNGESAPSSSTGLAVSDEADLLDELMNDFVVLRCPVFDMAC